MVLVFSNSLQNISNNSGQAVMSHDRLDRDGKLFISTKAKSREQLSHRRWIVGVASRLHVIRGQSVRHTGESLRVWLFPA